MTKLLDKLKKHLWLIVLLAAVVLAGWGIFRGEAIEMFEKARIICLECIGIG
jgi:hypothetical protein